MKQLPKIILIVMVLRLLALPISAQEAPNDFIENNPDTVAILCIEGDETIFAQNVDDAQPLASSFKVVILAEFARQVSLGNLDPEESVSLDDVNLYWMDGTDGAAHNAWLGTLDADAESATLEQIVDGMIIFSSNATTDYILSRLDFEQFGDLYELLGLENTDLPTYFLGNLLVLSNHEAGMTDLDYVESLDDETFFSEHDRLVDLFLNDAEWREAELAFRNGDNLGLPDIAVQSAFFNRFTPKSSASDMAILMQEPFLGDALSDEAHEIMRAPLSWIFDVNPANFEFYDEIATKSGAYAGVLTSLWYVDAKESDPITLVILYDNLPEAEWLDWITTFSYQQIELDVISSPEGCAALTDMFPDD